MEEENRFSILPHTVPDFMRGIAGILCSLQQADGTTADEFYALYVALSYVADDTERALDAAWLESCELHKLKKDGPA